MVAAGAAALGLALIPREAQANGCAVHDSSSIAKAAEILTNGGKQLAELGQINGITQATLDAIGRAGNPLESLPGLDQVGFLASLSSQTLNQLTQLTTDPNGSGYTAAGRQALMGVLYGLDPTGLLRQLTGQSVLLSPGPNFEGTGIVPTAPVLANPVAAVDVVREHFTLGDGVPDGPAQAAILARVRPATVANYRNAVTDAHGAALAALEACRSAPQRVAAATTLTTGDTVRAQLAGMSQILLAQLEEMQGQRFLFAHQLRAQSAAALRSLAEEGFNRRAVQ